MSSNFTGPSDDDMLNEEITCEEINYAIERQETTDKSCDPDGFHPSVLHKLGPCALKVLQLIFNWSLNNGIWIWNLSQVTFMRKVGKSTYTKAASYRPLSMSSYFGKILERILDSRLRNFISLQEKLDDEQEGFITG